MIRVGVTAVVTAAVTAVLTSMFWMWFYGSVVDSDRSANGRVESSGNIRTINRPGSSPIAIAEGVQVGPAGLAIPVAGVRAEQLVDTFTQARAGGARRHDAIDIMAPDGTPVLAAANGTVEKLFESERGGTTAYVRSPDRRWSYYYAHLQSYAPGLAEGQQVRRGQLIGRVGHSGSANPDGPHLHFAINRVGPQEHWSDGAPVNPYPLLAAKKPSG